MEANDERPGTTMHDRMMQLVRKYLDRGLQQATGVQGMMMRDAASRMFPRIEATIRGMTEDELKSELAKLQSQVHKVIGEPERPVKLNKSRRRGAKGRKRLKAKSPVSESISSFRN
ncbi:hypothetical protein [Alicyclobacillus sp. SO9]|uniref:hypothetical protein n=1 Tax=Alicyclobacillus sp. SO9 TaxID=2665646 RepID=UPI0018E7F6B5|nr:hypothetical protein [Alicyclobacillus sp. SO9]